MTLISIAVFILSTIGVLGFGCWDNDLEIPFLYSFGAFEANWWFHDKLKPGKPHLESHAKDGPPLVARTGAGGAIPWPYPAGFGSTGTVSVNWDADLKIQEKYTPVSGMYGVTNQKESDRTLSVEYYPNAANPNDYIARRLLGPQADWTELEALGDKLQIYNTNVFKSGTPFAAAEIGGPGNENDPRWNEKPLYAAPSNGSAFMPPLTSTGAGAAHFASPDDWIPRSVNDYSGAEYSGDNVSLPPGSAEAVYLAGSYRGKQYQEDKDGNKFTYFQTKGATWNGETADDQYKITFGGGVHENLITNAFRDSQYDGTTLTWTNQDGTQTGYTETFGWGVPNTVTDYYKGTQNTTQIQKDYITSQLTQENPLGTLSYNKITKALPEKI